MSTRPPDSPNLNPTELPLDAVRAKNDPWGPQHGWELVLMHPIDAQLDWDLENEEASLKPWVLCHDGV